MKRTATVARLLLLAPYLLLAALGCKACPGDLDGDKRIAPLMRGTLWWICKPMHFQWSKSDFEAAIQKQVDIGFDVLWLFGSEALMDHADGSPGAKDVLELVYGIANEKGMRVIIDLVPSGGALPAMPLSSLVACA